jgi:hypothetical protein
LNHPVLSSASTQIHNLGLCLLLLPLLMLAILCEGKGSKINQKWRAFPDKNMSRILLILGIVLLVV